MTTIDEFAAGFKEEPGFLNYAAFGPISAAVAAESDALNSLMTHARFGAIDQILDEDERARDALAAVTGFRADQVVLQPNTSTGLMHAMFGLTGGVLLSAADYPSLTFAAVRAEQTLGVVAPLWLSTDHGRVTPGRVRDQLTSTTVAVAVSLVDPRTGYLTDIDGIRQVIGNRLLIVDVIQGLGIVEAPWGVADVIVGGGHKWLRAGWGTGFMALSDRAVEQLIPVFSGYAGTAQEFQIPWDAVAEPMHGAAAFRVTGADPLAAGRLATALEEVHGVGVAVINEAVSDRVSRIIDLADEFAVPVVSSRAPNERAGIVVVEPPAELLTVLSAALFNHGIAATVRDGRVRFAAHAATEQETLDMLRAAFTSYASAIRLR